VAGYYTEMMMRELAEKEAEMHKAKMRRIGGVMIFAAMRLKPL
jgi:UDP-N-acetylmuramyl pentapeptide phosphotransferase/UDP-N-acetylglucosamine-1-phosphate transferase